MLINVLLKLGTPYPFTREYINKAPNQTGVYTLLDKHQNPLDVDCGTLLSDMWRCASQLPKNSVFWLRVEKLDGTYTQMEEFAEVLRASYGLVPKPNIGFSRQ